VARRGAAALAHTAEKALKAAKSKNARPVFAAGGKEIYDACSACHRRYAPQLNAHSGPRLDSAPGRADALSQAIRSAGGPFRPCRRFTSWRIAARCLSSVLMLDLRLLGIVGSDQPLAPRDESFPPVIWWTLPILLATGVVMDHRRAGGARSRIRVPAECASALPRSLHGRPP